MSPNKSAVRRASTLLAVSAATILLTGCSGGERDRLAEFRDDPTPDLVTMNMTGDAVENRNALIWDESSRMLYRDWLYLWHLNRPTRLTPEPSAW